MCLRGQGQSVSEKYTCHMAHSFNLTEILQIISDIIYRTH